MINPFGMKRDTFRNIVGGWIVGSFTGAMAALFIVEVPEKNHDLVVFMLGQLSGFVGAVVAFNFGTTKSSREKTELIGDMHKTATGKENDPVHTVEEN